jgi:hypothetical protein
VVSDLPLARVEVIKACPSVRSAYAFFASADEYYTIVLA